MNDIAKFQVKIFADGADKAGMVEMAAPFPFLFCTIACFSLYSPFSSPK